MYILRLLNNFECEKVKIDNDICPGEGIAALSNKFDKRIIFRNDFSKFSFSLSGIIKDYFPLKTQYLFR